MFQQTFADRLLYAQPCLRRFYLIQYSQQPWEAALLGPIPQKEQGDLRRGGDALGSSVAWRQGSCSFQKPMLGLGIASEMLVEPLAQVPLLRSSQRDPFIQDIIQATTGFSSEKD